jgi:tRNA-Thr(GGU) m(6)t(6)A37 methyltransferase TsaA
VPTFEPIGVVHSPYKEKREAPRQGVVEHARGTIEIFPRTGMADALSDLEGFERIFVVFHFHEAEHFRPKVQPPRSTKRRGVFATRSPHRPNPIGITVARLFSVNGLVLEVGDIDLIEGTPVLDLKPYVPYADAFPSARAGWLDEEASAGANADTDANASAHANANAKGGARADAPRDPIASYAVRFERDAERAVVWLEKRGVDLRGALVAQLSLGPAPHAYRRIRKRGDELEIAIKSFRATFVAEGRTMRVTRVYSGYKPKDLATREGAELDLHRAFVAR